MSTEPGSKPDTPKGLNGCMLAAAILVGGFFFFGVLRGPSTPPAPEPSLSNTDKDKAREVLQDLIRRGAIDKHELGAAGMARIWAGPKWEGLTFDQKTTFCAAVLAVHDAHGVRVISRSGKNIGSFDKTLGYQSE